MSTAPVPLPAGGEVAAAIKHWWPELSPTTLEDAAQLHNNWATHLDSAAAVSDGSFQPLFGGLLEGQAGDGLQTSLTANVRIWRDHATKHSNAAAAVIQVANMLRQLHAELKAIITLEQPAYDAMSLLDPPVAQEILESAEEMAQAFATSAAISIHATLSSAFGTAPGSGNNGSGIVTTSDVTPGVGGVNAVSGINPLSTGVGNAAAASGEPVAASTGTSAVSAPAAGAAAGSGAPAASSAAGSAAGQASGSASSAAAGAAPAAADASSAASSGASGSGVASGLGAPAALSSAMVPPQALGSRAQPGTAGSARGKDDPATGGAASNLSAPPATEAVSGAGGGGAGSAGGGVGVGGGGGGMMPVAPGPMAPYSPPGAGGLSSSALPVSAPPASLGPAAPVGAAAGGAGAMIAASRADRSTAAAAKQVNPDLVSAQQVLGGLVKACPARPIFWAVSVLRTPVGPQTLIAGSVGGGAYLPPEVSLPSTVRLAVLDPALPPGWAAAWMGWQSPLAILVDHHELVSKAVAGVRVSAMVTSELWPSRPDCGGDFLAISHEELVASSAPPLVGGHRLSATDPALAARLTALDRGGDTTKFIAAQLTRAVWVAGAAPDDTGSPIAVNEDADILGLVAEGTVKPEHWDDYQRDVQRRADGAVLLPEVHAPRDADDSAGSATARMWYRHYYARGRIAEMVTCWASQPVSIRDIAYCGVAAGFGAAIAAVVTELEKQLGNPPGSTGGTP